jgi:hypothetical protein
MFPQSLSEWSGTKDGMTALLLATVLVAVIATATPSVLLAATRRRARAGR